MASLLFNPIDDLPEGIHTIKYRHRDGDKKLNLLNSIQRFWLSFCLNIQTLYNFIQHKYLYYRKNYRNTFDENLKKRSANKYKFANHNINNFIFLLRRYVYLYRYMDDWEKGNKKIFATT